MRVSKRGLSLIELVISLGIASLLAVASVVLVQAITAQRKEADKQLSLQTTTALGVSPIALDLDTAGYRFPLSAWALRVYNNADVDTQLEQGTSTAPGPNITIAANCLTGSGKLRLNSDIVEVWKGLSNQPNDTLDSDAVVPIPANVDEYTITLRNLTALANEDVLVVANGNESCLVSVVDAAARLVTPVTQDLRRFVSNNHPATNRGLSCLKRDSRVYRLDTRTRYMVCESSATPPVFTLVKQTSDSRTGWYMNPPVAVQEGIENLQVQPEVVFAPKPSLAAPFPYPMFQANWGLGGSPSGCNTDWPQNTLVPANIPTPAYDFIPTSATNWAARVFHCYQKYNSNASFRCHLWEHTDPSQGPPTPPSPLFCSPTPFYFYYHYPVHPMTPRNRVFGMEVALVSVSPNAGSEVIDFWYPMDHPNSKPNPPVQDNYKRSVEFRKIKFINFTEVSP